MHHLRSFVTEDECCAILGGYEAPKTDGCIFDLGEDRINAAKSVARRAFRHTAIDLSEELSIRALAYGLEGSMSPHVDASVGKKPKFVAILSFGAACDFYADGTLLDLRSSDVLVFDAARVMHGVHRIKPNTSPLSHLPTSRISFVLWEAIAASATSVEDDVVVEGGLGELFSLPG